MNILTNLCKFLKVKALHNYYRDNVTSSLTFKINNYALL